MLLHAFDHSWKKTHRTQFTLIDVWIFEGCLQLFNKLKLEIYTFFFNSTPFSYVKKRFSLGLTALVWLLKNCMFFCFFFWKKNGCFFFQPGSHGFEPLDCHSSKTRKKIFNSYLSYKNGQKFC